MFEGVRRGANAGRTGELPGSPRSSVLSTAVPPIIRWLLRLGPTNPIAVRLVQNGSRRTRHMYIRAGYLAVLILVLLWLLLSSAGGGAGPGRASLFGPTGTS